MKSKFRISFVLGLFVLLLSSCLDSSDPLADYADWKVSNETYFTNMKDSVGYNLFSVPANRGGGGIYYKVLRSGSGKSPLYTDSVYVHYKGKLINNTVFDKTYAGTDPVWDNNENPVHFRANEVIKGWTEALMLMKVGDKWRIVIPWTLAYGQNGSGSISPYSTLIFDVELISFGTPLRYVKRQ